MLVRSLAPATYGPPLVALQSARHEPRSPPLDSSTQKRYCDSRRIHSLQKVDDSGRTIKNTPPSHFTSSTTFEHNSHAQRLDQLIDRAGQKFPERRLPGSLPPMP